MVIMIIIGNLQNTFGNPKRFTTQSKTYNAQIHINTYKSMVYKRTKHTKINKHFFVQNMAKTHALYNHCSTLFEYTKSPSAQISCKTRFTWTFQTDLVQDKIHVNISNWVGPTLDSKPFTSMFVALSQCRRLPVALSLSTFRGTFCYSLAGDFLF